jgi:plastocyanin
MSGRRGHLALLGLALAGVIVVAACFSEHSPTAPGGGTSAVCSLPLGPGVGGSTLVAIRGFAFLPNDVRVKAGSSVTWVNCEPAGTPSHTSTSNQGVWQSPLLAPGDAFTQTFETPGVFPYICAVHPFMTASITVE